MAKKSKKFPLTLACWLLGLCAFTFPSPVLANNDIQGLYMLFKDQSTKNCAHTNKGLTNCEGISLKVTRRGSSWIGRVVNIPSNAAPAYRGKGTGWIAFNARPNLRGKHSCHIEHNRATLLYGSVYDSKARHSKQGYVLFVPSANGTQLYLMPGERNPVLPSGQCNNRATYGHEQFWQITHDTSAEHWK